MRVKGIPIQLGVLKPYINLFPIIASLISIVSSIEPVGTTYISKIDVLMRNAMITSIEKFLRDVEHQSCHGILISQKSGISRKQNFQVDIHNGYIVVYIHNVI